MPRRFRYSFTTLLFALFGSAICSPGTDVLTNNYSNERTGANLNEALLSPSNVAPETFGRVAHYGVDGPVFAQPLIVSDLVMNEKAKRDVLFVATGSNSVYAFDAADATAPALWQRTLDRTPQGTRAMAGGILSTPVIDRVTQTIYVVTSLNDGGRPMFALHALDLRSGEDKLGSPVAIAGSVTVDNVEIAFAPSKTRIAVQRAALALAGDKVIVAFGGDFFEGWVFAYDKSNLRAPSSAFCTTCASRVSEISLVNYLDQQCILVGPGGGIWQSGRGPVVDASGRVYFFTGNKQHVIKDGCVVPQSSADNACGICTKEGGCLCVGNRSAGACRGPDACLANAARDGKVFDTNEALVQLDPRDVLKLTGWFRPENWNASGIHGLEFNDLDLGGSGPLLLPGTSRLIGGGKQGVMYVLDASSRRESCVASPTQPCFGSSLQSFQVAPVPPRPKEFYRHILGGPVVWARSPQHGGARVFVWRENDFLRTYRVTDQFADCDTDKPAPTTSHTCASVAQSAEFISQHPGGVLTVSAHGDTADTGIVWAHTMRTVNGGGQLMAFKAVPDAATPQVLRKLWDSEACEGDAIVAGSDFTPPTVANGRVYVATSANRVEVYSLIPRRECVKPQSTDLFGPLLQ